MLTRHGWLAIGHVTAVLVGSFGCESEKKPVLKIETPNAQVEVNKSPDGGAVEIQTERPADTP